MFLCRRLLSLAHIPKRASLVAVIRANSSNAVHIRTLASPGFSARGSSLEGVERTVPTATTQDLAIREFLSGLKEDLHVHSPAPVYRGPKGQLSICDAYLELRNRDTGLVANLPPATYACVIRQAFACEMYPLMDRAMRDIMELYDGEDSQRARTFRDILSTTDFTVLERVTVLSMLHVLQNSTEGLDNLPRHVVTNLIRMTIQDLDSDSADERLLELTLKLLSSHIQHCRVPSGTKSLVYNPPQLIHATFGLLQKIIPRSQQQAFNIFQDLVKTGQIPDEATQSADSSKHDFNTILYSALITAALHWGWRRLAYSLLRDLLSSSAPNDVKTNFVIDTIYSYLDTPNEQDIEACAKLIQHAHVINPVPNGLIRQFYTSAMKVGKWMAAETMYAFTREPETLSKHRYPPPQGLALAWLMQHLVKYSRKDYLVRTLAEEVLEESLPVPLQARASFISAAALKGHSRLARALWQRYSVGRDKHVILADSSLMIRMISLFSNVVRRLEEEARGLTASRGASSRVALEDMRKRLEDMRSFINGIILQYFKSHRPLSTARHEVLTSLARACFIVGKFTEGFAVLNVLLDRREVPDLYDVNVALSAMAEQRPRSAAIFIARMTEKGLRPDVVTYGTIMHHALAHRDSFLVEKMIELVKDLKDPTDQLKSATALVRAILENRESSTQVRDAAAFKAARRVRLQTALEIIESAIASSSISSPQTGKYLVRVSLQAGDPIIAYRFWKLLLKDSTDWEDREHSGQRRLIAVSLRKYWKDGGPGISPDGLKMMLSQLAGVDSV